MMYGFEAFESPNTWMLNEAMRIVGPPCSERPLAEAVDWLAYWAGYCVVGAPVP